MNYLNDYGVNDALNMLASVMGYVIIGLIFSIAYRTFACLALYNDAKARGIKDSTVYVVLEFFFPIIVAIVYLCNRKKAAKIQPKLCNNCRTTVNTNSTFCPNCLGTEFTDYLIPNNEKYHKNAKLFVVIAIVIFVVSSIVSSVRSQQLEQSSKDFLDKYGNGYNQYYDDDEYQDFEDFFNQFENEFESIE